MVDALLSLPTVLGSLIFMGVTSLFGFLVYLLSFQFIAKNRADDELKDVKEATGNLFRVVGWLISLFLSLTFADVYRELVEIELASEREAVAIMDTLDNLSRFNVEEATNARKLLITYTRAVIDYDWPALADDSLSPQTNELLSKLKGEILDLPSNTSQEETLRSRILADMDLVSDYRLSRQQKAQSSPPYVLVIVLFGYLITMTYFGVYRPSKSLVLLVALYTLLVGVVIYVILAMSDPFQGSLRVQPTPFENVLERVQSL